MGNSPTCFSPTPARSTKTSKHSHKEFFPPWLSRSLSSLKKSRKSQPPPSSSDVVVDDSYIKQQAQIATMLYHQHLQINSGGGGGGDLLLERSVSTKNPPPSYKRSKKLRSQSLSCSTSVYTLQLPDQDVERGENGVKSKHFVLVHGGGFGRWCWYKIIALLRESKHEVDAIDLTGSGAHFCDIDSIKTLAEYAAPVTDFLANLAHKQEVILVGHDIGGACISYAMEMYPNKVSKAIFLAATMLTDGQSALDVFSRQSSLSEINHRAPKFSYANGKNYQPTAIDFEKSLLEDFLFNRTPSKDIALASVSMRPVPFAPVAEKLSLSTENYGSISRFYVKTEHDFVIPRSLQESMIQSSPPVQVFELKNSDHSPFFSKPQSLHRLLTEISNLT